MDHTKSLELWRQHGDHVLMASPYKDQLVVEAHGCEFVDADGNRYLDLSSGQICALVGHGAPRLLERVVSQIARVAHTGTSFLSPVVLEASSRVAKITPGDLTKVLFLSTGAEANEYALRLAKTYTGKSGVLTFTKGYAGLTLATSSLTNYGKAASPIVPGTGYILVPDPTACPVGQKPIDWARALLSQSLELNRGLLDNIAAIIFEPILSAGGLIVLPDGYMQELRAVADSLGALLIADEAQTGVGRTGRWFGVEHDQVIPDILVMSKGLGGGFPASAVVTTPQIADAVMSRANQFSSHQSDPLSAVAAAAVIDIVESEGLVERAAQTGQYLMGRLNVLAQTRPHLTNVRGRGLMAGFDVFRDPSNPVPERDVGRGIEDYCRHEGVHLEAIQRNRFRILPPLTISTAEVDRFIQVLDAALAALAQGRAAPRPAQNAFTAAFENLSRKRRFAALTWAWNHSPNEWFRKLRFTAAPPEAAGKR